MSRTTCTPFDQLQREQALDSARSFIVKAPAGSGKTTLLTERFLKLLALVEEPKQVVAITFTEAAAAEMRIRIMDELRSDNPGESAQQVLQRSSKYGWKILELPTQLRIMTIDAFCRTLAIQQPLLSGLGGGLNIYAYPDELYRLAARRTLEAIDSDNLPELTSAIEKLLLWRDNNWHEIEELLLKMLKQRDRWMQDFVLVRNADWAALRKTLESPFIKANRNTLNTLGNLLKQIPNECQELLLLAHFAHQNGRNAGSDILYADLAEITLIPTGPFHSNIGLESAKKIYLNIAQLLLNQDGDYRKQINVNHGFPKEYKNKKDRLIALIASFQNVPEIREALLAIRSLPPLCYTEDEWEIVRSCFQVLRHAAGELQVVFAETGSVDFIEVTQVAQRTLNTSGDAMAVADSIHHILVDEFQDTSRKQHQLLSGLIAGWPERSGRTCFVVGDPMQSVYFFRNADSELFTRVEKLGIEVANDQPLRLNSLELTANFRTESSLVESLNLMFSHIFLPVNGSNITFTKAIPERPEHNDVAPYFNLHLKFVPKKTSSSKEGNITPPQRDALLTTQKAQIDEILSLIQAAQSQIKHAQENNKKYRIAILGRTRSVLQPIAHALRAASIPFRAVDLEKLHERPEVLDALALGRALLNPQDRIAWLSILRAPWCGLSLHELHTLVSNDDAEFLIRPVLELINERAALLSEKNRASVERVLAAFKTAIQLNATDPTLTLGTKLERLWLHVGGAHCVNVAALANLKLLWNCLDQLLQKEQDLLGPALDLALNELMAQPDPAVSINCGVQLMTIHKSKGLEFEQVFIPDMQVKERNSEHKMLSWLERGLPDSDETGQITEFLIAPFKSKGSDSASTKTWVDKEYKRRERQEMIRLFYVAATRAREKLYLFAKLEYDSNSFELIKPSSGLLASAWPALEEEIRTQFANFIPDDSAHTEDNSNIIQTLAASENNSVLTMPSKNRSRLMKPGQLRQLPDNPSLLSALSLLSSRQLPFYSGTGLDSFYSRHEGGLISRMLGHCVHAFMEKLANIHKATDWENSLQSLRSYLPQIAAQVRSAGIPANRAADIAADGLQITMQVARDSYGRWILSPHNNAQSEVAWTGIIEGKLRTVRADRVFCANAEPLSSGDTIWWLIDYKTVLVSDTSDSNSLPSLRDNFAPQLEAYSKMLRNLHGSNIRIHAGLYYPRSLKFDWWAVVE